MGSFGMISGHQDNSLPDQDEYGVGLTLPAHLLGETT